MYAFRTCHPKDMAAVPTVPHNANEATPVVATDIEPSDSERSLEPGNSLCGQEALNPQDSESYTVRTSTDIAPKVNKYCRASWEYT